VGDDEPGEEVGVRSWSGRDGVLKKVDIDV